MTNRQMIFFTFGGKKLSEDQTSENLFKTKEVRVIRRIYDTENWYNCVPSADAIISKLHPCK